MVDITERETMMKNIMERTTIMKNITERTNVMTCIAAFKSEYKDVQAYLYSLNGLKKMRTFY